MTSQKITEDKNICQAYLVKKKTSLNQNGHINNAKVCQQNHLFKLIKFRKAKDTKIKMTAKLTLLRLSFQIKNVKAKEKKTTQPTKNSNW